MSSKKAISLVKEAIDKTKSYDLDKVCLTLGDILHEKISGCSKKHSEETIQDKIDSRLRTAGIKSTNDIRKIILGLERVV
jgi:hypothetical protein